MPTLNNRFFPLVPKLKLGKEIRAKFNWQRRRRSQPQLENEKLKTKNSKLETHMFDRLTDKLAAAFKKLKGHGKLTEAQVGEGLARGAPGAARGRRQLQGHQDLHRPGEGAGRGRRGAAFPHPGPAGGQDRPRGAHRPPGRRVPQAGPGRPAAHRPDAGGFAGLRQDHHRGQAGPASQRARAARFTWCRRTCSAPRPSSS